jgi:hypothetical protein
LTFFKFFQIGSPTGLTPVAFSAELENGGYCKGEKYFDRLKDVVFPKGKESTS